MLLQLYLCTSQMFCLGCSSVYMYMRTQSKTYFGAVQVVIPLLTNYLLSSTMASPNCVGNRCGGNERTDFC